MTIRGNTTRRDDTTKRDDKKGTCFLIWTEASISKTCTTHQLELPKMLRREYAYAQDMKALT